MVSDMAGCAGMGPPVFDQILRRFRARHIGASIVATATIIGTKMKVTEKYGGKPSDD